MNRELTTEGRGQRTLKYTGMEGMGAVTIPSTQSTQRRKMGERALLPKSGFLSWISSLGGGGFCRCCCGLRLAGRNLYRAVLRNHRSQRALGTLPGRMLAGVPTEHVGVSAIVSSAPQHSTTGALPKLTVRPADKGDTRIGSGSLMHGGQGRGVCS